MVTEPQKPQKLEAPPQKPKGTGEGENPPENPPTAATLSALERTELEALREKKEQFVLSSREGIRLAKLVKVLEGKVAKATETPTELELKTEYPDFEDLDPEEKSKAIKQLTEKKQFAIREAKVKMREEYDTLPQETKEKIEKKGGFDSFKDYACDPDNAGQKNLENLAKQFLYEEPEEKPEGPETPPAPGLEEGGGGPPAPAPAPEGFTAAELKVMRNAEPERYRKLAREGKLKVRD